MQYRLVQKNIMRRIYYAFALRMATHPIILTGALLVGSVYVLSVFIHVASIVRNALAIPLAQIPHFIANAFLSTDTLTLVSVLCVAVSVVAFEQAMAGTFVRRSTI